MHELNEEQIKRLKARDLENEERKVNRMEPATFNYMYDFPAWMKYDPMFNAIWDEIKTWDIGVPTEYRGHTGATGNHVSAILAAVIDAKLYTPKSIGSLDAVLPDIRA